MADRTASAIDATPTSAATEEGDSDLGSGSGSGSGDGGWPSPETGAVSGVVEAGSAGLVRASIG